MLNRKSYKIKQTFSCDQRWRDMKEMGDARFCDQCEKKVFDLTTASDIRLYKLLKESEGQVCGRISPEKLNRKIHETSPFKIEVSKKYLTIPAILTALIGLLRSKSVIAQTTADVPQVKIEHADIEVSGSEEEKILVRGVVRESDHAKEVLPFANVAVKKNSVVIGGATTDFDGKFQVKIDQKFKGEVELEVSYVGYETTTRTIKVGLPEEIEVEIEMHGGELNILGGMIMVEEKKSFWKKRQKKRDDCDF